MNRRRKTLTCSFFTLLLVLTGVCLLSGLALAGEENGEGLLFTVNQQNEEVDLVCGADFELYAYAPGADWIDLYFDADENRGWRTGTDGDVWEEERWDYWHSGDYRIEAQAWFPDFDENNEPVMDIDEDGEEYHVHHPVEASILVHV